MKSSNKYNIIIDKVADSSLIPDDEEIHRWVSKVLTSQEVPENTELGIRITDNNEIQSLNKNYRNKDKPTNVLSFPFEVPENLPEVLDSNYLGDIICSFDYISKEAEEQKKELKAHWAHIVIHGTLHLLGFDHIKNEEAEIMEQNEIDILNSLGYKNPYSN